MSTQKQGEGVSLEAQKDAITDFAARNDLSIIRWFEEKETAAKSGRPIFNNMLKQLKKGGAEGLVMHKIDRSARNLRDWALVSELPRYGVKPYFAADDLDFDTRGGRLSANLQAVIAEDYIHNLREECIKGLRGRLKQGLYPFRAPIGYLDNGKGKPKTPCPEKAPIIKKAFDLYASGEHSITTLHAEMRRSGLVNHEGNPVSRHTIEAILRNPFYAGLIHIRRTGENFDGIHEPLISLRQFQLVQRLKEGKYGKKVTRHDFQYRGVFSCGTCGRSMTAERQKAHVYYRCHTQDCLKNIVRGDRLEAAVVSAYDRLELSDADAEAFKKDWNTWLESTESQGLIKSLELRIAKAEERLQSLTDLLIDGAIDRDTHDERKPALKFEIATLKEERDELRNSDVSEADIRSFFELATNLTGLHKSLKSDEKRIFLRNCFSNFQVHQNKPCLEPHAGIFDRNFGELSAKVHQLRPLFELMQKRKLK